MTGSDGPGGKVKAPGRSIREDDVDQLDEVWGRVRPI